MENESNNYFFREGINVLSLFDGMSCGQIALERCGIKVNKYFASEIDKHAIKVTQHNYPNTLQIGSVIDVKGADLPNIDLLYGGSPCQGFSFSGKQLNFEDPRSKLFFEFVRLVKEVNPKYWMLENVKMKKEYQDVISNLLGVEPIEINSSLVSAQNRKRLYWTNFSIEQPENKGIVFNDIKDNNYDLSLVIPNKYTPTLNNDINTKCNKSYRLGGYMKQGQGQRVYSMNGKSVCLSALGGGWGAKTGLYYDNGTIRKPTQKELEKLQTVTEGYTEIVNYNQAAKLLGNGWTVDVIVDIFNKMVLQKPKCVGKK